MLAPSAWGANGKPVSDTMGSFSTGVQVRTSGTTCIVRVPQVSRSHFPLDQQTGPALHFLHRLVAAGCLSSSSASHDTREHRPPATTTYAPIGRRSKTEVELWQFCFCWLRAGNATLNRALLQEADGEPGSSSTICSSKCAILENFFPPNLEPETRRAELAFIVLP